MSRPNQTAGCVAPIAVLFLFGMIIFYPVALWTNRNLDFWATYFNGEATDVPFWISGIASFFMWWAMIICNIISEILRYFV